MNDENRDFVLSYCHCWKWENMRKFTYKDFLVGKK